MIRRVLDRRRTGALVRVVGPLALGVALLLPPVSRAQLLQLQAGTSTLYRAQGASLSWQLTRFRGLLAGGTQDGQFRLGASVQTQWRGYDVLVGDDSLRLELPTDVFDGSHLVLSRGVEVSRTTGRFRFSTFAGASSRTFGASFFQTAEADEPLGAVSLDASLTESTSLFFRSLFSHKQTLITGVHYRPQRWLKGSVAIGSGSGDGYLATAATAEKPWVSAKAEYVHMGERFRRVITAGPQGTSSEVDRDNLQLTLRPASSFAFGGGRQHLLQPLERSQQVARGRVDNFFARGKLAGFDLSGSRFQSNVEGRSSSGLSFGLNRRLTPRLATSFGAYHSRLSGGASSTIYDFTVRETLTPRLGLLQTVNRSGNQTNVAFGGILSGNRLNVALDYQTVFVPFQASGVFKQALAMSLRLRPLANFELGANSFVAPDGHVRYTFTAGKTLVRYGAGKAAGGAGIAKYIVRGMVVDEAGQGVAGLAFQVDGVTTYSDRAGHFSVRLAKRKLYPLKYLPDDSVSNEEYELVSAPQQVRPEREDGGEQLTVQVRHKPRISHGTQFDAPARAVSTGQR